VNISGNTIFIPGATSGIGLALAIALQANDNTVIVGGRRTELLDRIAAEHPGLHTIPIDTADPASIDAAAKQVLAEHPELNVLVTMAGIMRIEDWHVPESFLASAESIITTNVLGPIRLTAAFIEHLQTQTKATIITVLVGVGVCPLKITPSYNASKAAIHMLSESIRLQLADTSIEVKELVPPGVRTALLPGFEDSAASMPLDEYIAEVVALIENQPDAPEIQVEAVKFLRYGEARGDYEQVVSRAQRNRLLGQLNRTGRTRKYVSTTHRSRRRHPPSPRPQATQRYDFTVFGGPITLFPKHSRRPATPRHNTANTMTALDTSSNSGATPVASTFDSLERDGT